MTEPAGFATDPVRSLSFGPFVWDTANRELHCRGRRVPLQPQPAALLDCLLARPGTVVRQAELRDRLWDTDTHVEFARALHGIVAKLRRALGDTGGTPRFVETVRGHGYRFIGSLRSHGGAVPERPLVVVVPVGLDGDAPPPRVFALTSLVISACSRSLDGIAGVIARRSAFEFGRDRDPVEAAALLGAEFVLDVQIRAGRAATLLTELTSTRDRRVIWDRRVGIDPGAVEDALRDSATTAAAALRRTLVSTAKPAAVESPRTEPVRDVDDRVLEGMFLISQRTPESLGRAADRFRAVLVDDPADAAAHAGLAQALLLAAEIAFDGPATYVEARGHARLARERDPTMAAPRLVLAHVANRHDWDWEGAEREYRAAIDLAPSFAPAHQGYAEFLSQQLRHEAAVDRIRHARRIDPLAMPVRAVEAWLLFHARLTDEAVQRGEELLTLAPTLPLAHFVLGRCALQAGDATRARERFRDALSSAGARADYLIAAEGCAAARAGDRGTARAVLDELQASQHPYLAAKVLVALGRTSAALDCLERGRRVRSGWMTDLAVDPELDRLRDEPRFQALLDALRLPRQGNES